MTLSWLVPMVSAGLLGSVHCIGMCGGLIAVASDGAAGMRQRLAVQAGYQAARLSSYVVLGVVAGSVGQALDLAGQAAGLGKAAAVLAGATMTLWGLVAMLQASGTLKRKLPGLRLLPPRAVAWLAGARQRPPLIRPVLLGGVLSRMKRHIPLLSAACVFVLGVVTLNSRVNVPAFAMASVVGTTATMKPAAARAPSADDCPCHKKRHAQ